MAKVTIGTILETYNTLSAIKDALKEPLHRFTAAAMRRQLADKAEPVLDERKDVDKLAPNKWFEARVALAREWSVKDEDGNPVTVKSIQGEEYKIAPEKLAEFTKASDALTAEHKTAIDTYQAAVDKYNTFLTEPAEFPKVTSKLKLSWFNNSVAQEALEILFDFIIDDLSNVEVTEAKR